MYPHIIIAYAAEPEALKLKRQLRKRGIFTEISDFDGILKLKTPPELVIILSKSYSSRAYAALLYVRSRLPGCKTFVIGDTSDYTNVDIDSSGSYTLADKGNCISDEISRLTGFDFTYAKRSKTASDLSDLPLVYFRGTRLFLTETESQIVHLLAVIDDICLPIERIAAYVDLAEKSVSSYVSSINNTSRLLTGENMIFNRRKQGYSLLDEAK